MFTKSAQQLFAELEKDLSAIQREKDHVFQQYQKKLERIASAEEMTLIQLVEQAKQVLAVEETLKKTPVPAERKELKEKFINHIRHSEIEEIQNILLRVEHDHELMAYLLLDDDTDSADEHGHPIYGPAICIATHIHAIIDITITNKMCSLLLDYISKIPFELRLRYIDPKLQHSLKSPILIELYNFSVQINYVSCRHNGRLDYPLGMFVYAQECESEQLQLERLMITACILSKNYIRDTDIGLKDIFITRLLSFPACVNARTRPKDLEIVRRATMFNSYDLFKFVEHGVNPAYYLINDNTPPLQCDMTPLMWAATTGSEEFVKDCLQAGAKIDDIDNQGNTAVDHAKKLGHKHLIHILEEYVHVAKPTEVEDMGQDSRCSIM